MTETTNAPDQELGRKVDALTREVRNVRDLVLAYNPRIRELEDRVDAAERQVSALGLRMDSAEARPDPLEDRIDSVERASDAVRTRLSPLETKALGTDAWTEEVRRALESNSGALAAMREDLDGLRKLLDPEE